MTVFSHLHREADESYFLPNTAFYLDSLSEYAKYYSITLYSKLLPNADSNEILWEHLLAWGAGTFLSKGKLLVHR